MTTRPYPYVRTKGLGGTINGVFVGGQLTRRKNTQPERHSAVNVSLGGTQNFNNRAFEKANATTSVGDNLCGLSIYEGRLDGTILPVSSREAALDEASGRERRRDGLWESAASQLPKRADRLEYGQRPRSLLGPTIAEIDPVKPLDANDAAPSCVLPAWSTPPAFADLPFMYLPA